jgi:hypothetical protein
MVRKSVNKSYETKFEDQQIQDAIYKIITDKIDMNGFKIPKLVKKSPAEKINVNATVINQIENVN